MRSSLTRRFFFGAAVPLAVTPLAAAEQSRRYRFRTAQFEITLMVEYHDRYYTRGFPFREELSQREFCLGANGERDRDCMKSFRGSLAIARYQVRSRMKGHPVAAMREYVRTVDRDLRLPERPPFDRTIRLQQGVCSDLQVFGYQPEKNEKTVQEAHGPWYLFRQDLYLEPHPKPFLAIFWKHALDSIRALDIIPGEQTWPFLE